jgi:magnesium-transporting ATPase (P-type)
MLMTPHREKAEAVVSALGSDVTLGLSRAEAQRRRDHYGPNQLEHAPETSWWKKLLEQFESFLVIILLVATVISMVEWLLQEPRKTVAALRGDRHRGNCGIQCSARHFP